MTLVTRKPTGKPPWPILLLAGAEKAGKSYAAAEASASDLIGRTLWVGVGEDAPDEYGAIDGVRFEIAQHDGTYRGILTALTDASAEPHEPGVPNLLVLDSGTRMWDLLCDEAQVAANERARRKAARSNRPAPDDDVQITMDLWNVAKQRWQHIVDVLRDHDGPSIITARLEQVTVMRNGEPTAEKTWKVKAEKGLPYDVGAIVELPVRGEAYLTGVRSLRFRANPTERVPYDGFTVDKLWRDLGLAEEGATSPRQHTPNATVTAQQVLTQIAELADRLEGGRAAIAQRWADLNDGQQIQHATDLDLLEAFRDDLAARIPEPSSTEETAA